MIILKAEGTLAAVFHKTIKVMEQNVEWNETFAINNNTLILPGTLKSLFFSFDNKKVLGNVIEEPIKEEPRLMLGNALLENTINLVLYIFGKWGKIKGLTVEKDYRQLEQQMNDILREVEVQASLDATQCRFYHEGIRITYEEVIERILEYMKPDYLNEEEEEQDDTEIHDVSDWEKKYQLGLWHKIVWKSYETGISKKKLSAKERAAGRIGNDFYITGYQCPECKKPMYMVVYPKNKEFHIDTDEGRVILARAYTCMDCHRFYTPKPYKLLMEGSIYMMDFDYKMKESGVNRREARKLVKRELQDAPDAIAGVSDLYGGLTGNQVMGLWGHKKSYWTRQDTKAEVCSEAWADILQSYGVDKQYEYVSTYLPGGKAFVEKTVEELIEKIKRGEI